MKNKTSYQAVIMTVLSIIYAATMSFISCMPQKAAPLPRQVINNLLHIPAFAVFFFLLYALSGYIPIRSTNRRMLFASLISASFGIVIEIFQLYVPGRESSVLDFLLNAVGIAFGLSVIAILEGKKRNIEV